MSTKSIPASALVDLTPRRLLIGDEWVDSATGEQFETINPATGMSTVSVARAGEVDVDRAVTVARRALAGPWRNAGPAERQHLIDGLADLVLKHGDELALLDSIDMGAPLHWLKARSQGAAQRLRWYSAQARGVKGETIENSRPRDFFTYTVKEPVGVVGAITPWNGPLGAAISKLGPVLATGCTAVLKPAEESPLSALRFAELCLEAGIPDGVVNVLTGDGATGAALAAHPGVDKVSFTGSVETGRRIVEASAGNLKRLTLELGGKSAAIVFADADLEAAANGVGPSIFLNSGQVCIAGSRLFVERSIFEEFVARVADYARSLRVGDPLHEETNLGPVASKRQLGRVLGYLRSGTADGARLVCGGETSWGDARDEGYYVPPTIFVDVQSDMAIYKEEVFGPVLVASPFETEDEVIGRANETDFGLGAYVWTRDVSRVQRMVDRTEAGSIWVNTPTMIDMAVPFGGWKHSGYGHDAGVEQIAAHQRLKAVWVAR